eukprot:2062679-Lingulodinium_polyedra.AAC.1
MFHALLDYAIFPTARASAQGPLPQLPDVVRCFLQPWKFITLSCGYIVSGCWQWRSIEGCHRVE